MGRDLIQFIKVMIFFYSKCGLKLKLNFFTTVTIRQLADCDHGVLQSKSWSYTPCFRSLMPEAFSFN